MVESNRAFVIGAPISHSKSPILHGHWLKKLQLDGTYEPILVEPEGLPDFVDQIRNGKFVGGNVTIPNKEAMILLVDRLSPTAKAIGAVNTLWMEGDELIGHNTDAYGFAANLDEFVSGWAEGETAIVLGAGGASRAIVYQLIKRSFKTIFIANRTIARAKNLAGDFGFSCNAISLADVKNYTSQADIIINTTSIGMKIDDALPLDLSLAKSACIVTDIVYTPLETPLLKSAKTLGLRSVDGVGMLLHQAVPGFEKWFGVKPDVTTELRNIVLGNSLRES